MAAGETQGRAEMCERDPLYFMRYFFKQRIGSKMIIAPHHEVIMRTLHRVIDGEITRLIINISPGYSKTELCTINMMAYGLAIDPRAKFLHLSYSHSLALLNTTGASATVAQSVSGYSRTISLVTHDVLNWYDWYYEVPVRTGEAIFDDIPPYPASTLTVTVDNTGGTASIGVLVIGKSRRLGATQWEASRSIADYSRAVESDDGTVSLSVGNYSKRLNVDVFIDRGFESEATRILEEFRATPLVFVGSSLYSMTILYGFLGPWNVPISSTGRPASIEIRGLV